jgi:hypothetical protein
MTVTMKRASVPQWGVLPLRAKINEPIQNGRQAQTHWGRFAFQMAVRVLMFMLTFKSPKESICFSCAGAKSLVQQVVIELFISVVLP